MYVGDDIFINITKTANISSNFRVFFLQLCRNIFLGLRTLCQGLGLTVVWLVFRRKKKIKA